MGVRRLRELKSKLRKLGVYRGFYKGQLPGLLRGYTASLRFRLRV